MKNSNIKTIDINCLEWRDKVNGNSYFAGTVTLNFGAEFERSYKIPFQYGYGEQYKHEAFEVLESVNELKREQYSNGSKASFWQFCKDNNIILRSNIQHNCKKSQLKNI
jgi:hypothetical protein